jgi:hypothetical protein
MHLIVPAGDVQPFEANGRVPTPVLDKLLTHWRESSRLELGEVAWDLPTNLVYAAALGLPADEGGTPWAAHETGTAGAPCAWIEPCHVRVGISDLVMSPQAALQLGDNESRAFMALMQPYFESDGIALHFHSATRWLATGEVFRGFVSAPLAVVEGRDLDAYSPSADNEDARVKLRKLQNEMQMLLYTHALNDARAERRLPPVNSFWVSGAGVMDQAVAPRQDVKLDDRLLIAVRRGDAMGYAQAWAQIEREIEAFAAQGDFMLTLGGPQRAITWHATPASTLSKIKGFLGLRPIQNARDQL